MAKKQETLLLDFCKYLFQNPNKLRQTEVLGCEKIVQDYLETRRKK